MTEEETVVLKVYKRTMLGAIAVFLVVYGIKGVIWLLDLLSNWAVIYREATRFISNNPEVIGLPGKTALSLTMVYLLGYFVEEILEAWNGSINES